MRPGDLHIEPAHLPAELGRRDQPGHGRAGRHRRPGADPSPGLQPGPEPGGTGALRLQRRRQQRLPQIRRRMERRLPRGVHDRRPGSAARRQDPQEPARLHRARRQRDLPDHPQHLPRPRPSGRSPTPTRPSCGPTRSRCRTPPSPTARPRSRRSCPPGSSRRAAIWCPSNPGNRGDLPSTNQTDSPDGAEVNVTVPFEPGKPIANSNVRNATTSLPLGMGLNPSAADGLVACTDAQLGKGTRARSPARRHRRSARSRSKPRRCPPAR